MKRCYREILDCNMRSNSARDSKRRTYVYSDGVSMNYDRRHEFINIFVLWIGLHILGGGFGILLGEIIGQLIAAVLNSVLGHFAAFVVFEAVLWLSRRTVFRSIPFDPMWKLVTQTLWIFTEVLGWSIGTQAALMTPTPRFTEGAV